MYISISYMYYILIVIQGICILVSDICIFRLGVYDIGRFIVYLVIYYLYISLLGVGQVYWLCTLYLYTWFYFELIIYLVCVHRNTQSFLGSRYSFYLSFVVLGEGYQIFWVLKYILQVWVYLLDVILGLEPRDGTLQFIYQSIIEVIVYYLFDFGLDFFVLF